MTGSTAADFRMRWGTSDEGCSILHVDMDAFFASVELVDRPDLHGLPVIVGGSERSVVLAATYEARAFGVHSAMPMAQARRLCPQAVVLPPDLPRYREVSHSVMQSLREVTGLVEQLSVDEAFLDVQGALRRLGRPHEIGARIRNQIQQEHKITCSIGIASTKFVAKIASVHAKPDGMLVIPKAAAVPFLRSLPVRSLWGVGAKTQDALARYGIRTVAELADADISLVQRAVGRASGAHLHDLSWGRDPRAVEPTRAERSIGAETTFAEDTRDIAQIEAKLLALADRCASRLRGQALMAQTVSIKVRTSDFRTLTRSRTMDNPSDGSQTIFQVARALFSGVDLRGLAVRLVGVRAESLKPREQVVLQPTLEESTDDSAGMQREVESAMDLVRRRFGTAAIGIGTDGWAPTTVRSDVDLS